VDAVARDRWVLGPEIAQVQPVSSRPGWSSCNSRSRDGLADPPSVCSQHPTTRNSRFQPVPEFDDGIADTVVPMRDVFVHSALRTVIGLSAVGAADAAP
jgi:hypothetical protein